MAACGHCDTAPHWTPGLWQFRKCPVVRITFPCIQNARGLQCLTKKKCLAFINETAFIFMLTRTTKENFFNY